jgi:hypothetical protein
MGLKTDLKLAWYGSSEAIDYWIEESSRVLYGFSKCDNACMRTIPLGNGKYDNKIMKDADLQQVLDAVHLAPKPETVLS